MTRMKDSQIGGRYPKTLKQWLLKDFLRSKLFFVRKQKSGKKCGFWSFLEKKTSAALPPKGRGLQQWQSPTWILHNLPHLEHRKPLFRPIGSKFSEAFLWLGLGYICDSALEEKEEIKKSIFGGGGWNLWGDFGSVRFFWGPMGGKIAFRGTTLVGAKDRPCHRCQCWRAHIRGTAWLSPGTKRASGVRLKECCWFLRVFTRPFWNFDVCFCAGFWL